MLLPPLLYAINSTVLPALSTKEIFKDAKELLLVNNKLDHFILFVRDHVRKQENSLMIIGCNHLHLTTCWLVLNIPEYY
jgi:hypothetical protein